ncbi:MULTISPECIES: DUF3263 domain-containing protein [Nocardiaceae]|uniref:DUF3263 domain-containing protein n=1 Tax=Nocardiaceae TaxID=85025 RepID=UPI0005230102|nr:MULTISPECIES: DUF3263 domain-containing protein [Rhodococcus]OZD11440.1 DUF3263 domain-containing protein [Rhodococcus sp. 06-156-3C]OZD13675.1 DUF3263 domain-containing protein [Rhodococcus sp. 06-156-4a]OZD21984.1 DUF3263 domain-containing protein [Rhodococcus sp. 06-156-4C]OZD30299.1 DUF3263 domain-containing protein [Rhodococcus sp. 06-156-3]OZD37706.1 DUF3263 domain-containing protein [Rhodococcus sp. 06-156-3b]
MRNTTSNSVDDAILAFGRSWYGYGGGSDEDIYVHFGLPARSYFTRLSALLDGPAGKTLDDETRESMRAVCARRLR